jgi:hypothetical protein
MPCSFNDLFGRKFVDQLNGVCDLVDSIKDLAKEDKIKLRWTKSTDWNEYGFYIDGVTTKINLYFGIWFEAWEAFGTPLFFAVDDSGSDTKVSDRVREYVESYNNSYVEYKYFEECSTIVLSKEFLEQEQVEKQIVRVLKDLQMIIK